MRVIVASFLLERAVVAECREKQKEMRSPGIEPATSRSEDGRFIHLAIAARLTELHRPVRVKKSGRLFLSEASSSRTMNVASSQVASGSAPVV
jgi:hypothetical protein